MNITLRQLSYVIALAETRHFGQAAERCHVSQPALSNQIRELENRLGVTLFLRGTRSIDLTPAGQDVLTTALRITAELERMQDAVHWNEGLSGRLRLGVIPTIAPYLLPKALPMIQTHAPKLDLRIREARTDELLKTLDEGRLDAAIIALPSGANDLVETFLMTDRFLLAGAPDEIARMTAQHHAPNAGEIDPERLLLLDEGHCLADQALEVCGLRRGDRHVDVGAASLGTLCRLAASGLGVTFLPEIACEAEANSIADLAVTRFADPQPHRRIGLVRRDLSRHSAWFDDLANLLRQAAGHLTASQA